MESGEGRGMKALVLVIVLASCAPAAAIQPRECVRREYFEDPLKVKSRQPFVFDAAFCGEYGWECGPERDRLNDCEEI
ncbi:MAG: hypothetical protein E6R03_12120 [Hyphomicrobiaceae bacterium]|nr:MAG: hypothetical protein E6R03_12120 [Hyphomicrobiaceae bacterium]